MRATATSPGKKFDVNERVSVLRLYADDLGESMDLATINRFIAVKGLELLAAYARTIVDAPASPSALGQGQGQGKAQRLNPIQKRRDYE